MPDSSSRTFAWLLLAGLPLAVVAAAHSSRSSSLAPPGHLTPAQGAAPAPIPAPSDDQIQELKQRIVRNQHQDDQMLQEYERTERDHLMASGRGLHNRDVLEIMVPTGTGEAKVELERDGKPSATADRAQQWRSIAKTLSNNTHPDDPEVKREFERAQKRLQDRAETVDAMSKAFRFRYAGREMLDGRLLLRANFEPEPGFHSSVRFSSVWKHIHGTVWVDESSAQIVRVTGELFDDVSIADGLVVKVYKGSRMTLDQTEIAPGLWAPTHAQIDLSGRLFLLAASYHELVDDSMFARVGMPAEALQVIFHGHLDDPPE